MPYTYDTELNGYTLEIFKDGKSIAYLQGDEAVELGNALDRTETDEVEQNLLGMYDMSELDYE